MSRNNRNVKSVVNAARKPCCKVCKDAGKTESEFSSHWPRDTEGKTICPTLLAQDCRYCGKAGHTVKYCHKLEKDNAAREKASKSVQPNPVPKPAPSNAAKAGGFAVLMDSDSDSDDSPRSPKRTQKKAPAPMKEEYPALGGTWTRLPAIAPVASVSFAAMACKPKEIAIAEKQIRDEERLGRAIKEGFVALKRESAPLSEREKAKIKHTNECFRGLNGKSWADMEDSDDEDEDDDMARVERFMDRDREDDYAGETGW
jgi:hypothetical protein